jgi:site-specific DNA recombinase
MGEWSYNRSRWVSRPRRERRAKALALRGRRENDPREWVRLDAPELRIIEPELWRQAKARRVMTKDRWHSQLKAQATAKNNSGRPSRQLFQLRCGVCGGSYIRMNRDKYGCSTRRESGGTRSTMKSYAHIPTTNTALIELVKRSALSPQMLSVFADEVAAESARVSAQPKAAMASVKRAKEKADKKIANIVDAIATFGLRDQPELHGQLKAATQERDAAVAELARLQSGRTRVPAAVTAQTDALRRMLDAVVAGDVSDPAVMVRARMPLAQLVDPFDAYPHPTGGTEFRAKLRRPLARRLGGTPPDFDVIRPNVVKVVAGAGFEPATFGL